MSRHWQVFEEAWWTFYHHRNRGRINVLFAVSLSMSCLSDSHPELGKNQKQTQLKVNSKTKTCGCVPLVSMSLVSSHCSSVLQLQVLFRFRSLKNTIYRQYRITQVRTGTIKHVLDRPLDDLPYGKRLVVQVTSQDLQQHVRNMTV